MVFKTLCRLDGLKNFLIANTQGIRGGAVLQRYLTLSRFFSLAQEIDTNDKPTSALAEPHAVVSIFDMLKIGIGPSSSHTVGPMRAALMFGNLLKNNDILSSTAELRLDLYGSLALTGDGHGTPSALLMGMEGETPQDVPTSLIEQRVKVIHCDKKLRMLGEHDIDFDPAKHIIYHRTENLPFHPNGMRFSAYNTSGDLLAAREYYSIGGGFVVAGSDIHSATKIAFCLEDSPQSTRKESNDAIPFPFVNANDLMELCESHGKQIADIVYSNERVSYSADEINVGIQNIWRTMSHSIQDGCLSTESYLPGKLNVKRRAPSMYLKLMEKYRILSPIGHHLPSPGIHPTTEHALFSSSFTLDWLSCFAMAVNEENAAGGRVVTAPTNGAAGVIPSVLKYFTSFCSKQPDKDVSTFLLTASAIGMLYKRGASISAAEMGCQGEIGVASSMAAAGLTSVMGGTVRQIENAAEIAMEHSLGLTCDPIGGLVQIPCIERNAIGAAKAYLAAQLALNGDGRHRVSLDQVIETMKQTGQDMQMKYKETSLGGLAVNVPLC